MRMLLPVAVVCAVLLVSGTCGWTAETDAGDRVTYSKDKTIDDDLLTAGNQVTVDSTVKGDLTAAGSTVSVSGPVEGSVMLAGATVNVTGTVGNDAWLTGSQVKLDAPVRDNAYMAGSTVTLLDKARVGRDLLVGGASVDVMGDVGRDLRAGANSITISGSIGRDARLRAQSIKLTSSAVINGNLYYPRDAKTDIAKGAVIRGQVRKTSPMGEHRERPSFWSALLGWFGWLLASIVFGLVFVALFPIRTQQTVDTILAMPWASLGIGFLAFIVIPIAAIMFMITIIGLPVGIALLLIYPVLLYVGYILAAVAVGLLLMRRIRPSVGSVFAHVALGLLVFSIIKIIPVLGGLILFVAMLTGFGALLIGWWQSRRPRAADATPPPASSTP